MWTARLKKNGITFEIGKPWINAPTNKPRSDAQTMQNWQQIVTFQDAIHHYPGCKRMKQEYLNGFGKWAKSNT